MFGNSLDFLRGSRQRWEIDGTPLKSRISHAFGSEKSWQVYKLVKPAKPIKLTKPTTESAKPAKRTNPAEPIKSAKPAKRENPTNQTSQTTNYKPATHALTVVCQLNYGLQH